MYKLMSRLKKVKITRGKNVFKLPILPRLFLSIADNLRSFH